VQNTLSRVDAAGRLAWRERVELIVLDDDAVGVIGDCAEAGARLTVA
jgi:hypothetical protein